MGDLGLALPLRLSALPGVRASTSGQCMWLWPLGLRSSAEGGVRFQGRPFWAGGRSAGWDPPPGALRMRLPTRKPEAPGFVTPHTDVEIAAAGR